MVARRWLLVATCVAIAIAVLAARPVRTPGPLARDFEAYWSAGVARDAAANPYGRAVWNGERHVPGVDATRDELLPFVGPPATLLVWSVAARWRYEAAARVWWAVLALALLVLVASSVRDAGAPFDVTVLFGAALLAIAFAPISSDLALGQLALPAFAGACALTVVADRSLVAAVAGACIAFVQPNAALGLLSQLGRNRATLALIAGAVVTYGLGVVAGGAAWPVAYARILTQHAAAERFDAIQFSPASIAYGFGADSTTSIAIGIVLAAIAVAAALGLALRVRERFARFAAFSALAPFVASFVHEHDLAVAFAAALWCALRARGAARTLALAGTLLVGTDWLGLAQRPTGIAQSFLLAIAMLAAFVALGEADDLRRTTPAGIALAGLFLIAAFLAAHHPMPIWPDALGRFHAPQDASPAAVWLAEQRATGLLTAVPAWSLLRSFPLLGCALLAYAIYRHSSCCRTA